MHWNTYKSKIWYAYFDNQQVSNLLSKQQAKNSNTSRQNKIPRLGQYSTWSMAAKQVYCVGLHSPSVAVCVSSPLKCFCCLHRVATQSGLVPWTTLSGRGGTHALVWVSASERPSVAERKQDKNHKQKGEGEREKGGEGEKRNVGQWDDEEDREHSGEEPPVVVKGSAKNALILRTRRGGGGIAPCHPPYNEQFRLDGRMLYSYSCTMTGRHCVLFKTARCLI